MWIVMNIGCIECGVSSNVVGTFDDIDEAKKVAARLGEELSWREGGQNSYEVFLLPAVGTINDEYRAAANEQNAEKTK